MLEDAPNSNIDLFPAFADAQDADAQLTYTVTANDNPGLFSSTSISTGRYLVLDDWPNANGTAHLTVKATDTGGLSVSTSLTVIVTAVNDAPSFVAGPDQTIIPSYELQTVQIWATGLSAGPANE